jgi:hypothetical protein
MAPKKKEGSKAKAKKKGKGEPSPEEIERLDLLEKATRCCAESTAERELGEQFIEQSERLKHFWEIEKSAKSVSRLSDSSNS